MLKHLKKSLALLFTCAILFSMMGTTVLATGTADKEADNLSVCTCNPTKNGIHMNGSHPFFAAPVEFMEQSQQKGTSSVAEKLSAMTGEVSPTPDTPEISLSPVPFASSSPILGRVQMRSADTLLVTVSQTGTLQALLENTEGYVQEKVTSLTLATATGAFLNYADFSYMRESLPNLTYLNIEKADCLNDFDPANPVEHEIPRAGMNSHKALQTIVLSEKVSSIGRAAFSGCVSLRGDLVIPDNITNLGALSFGFYGSVYPQFDSLTLSDNLVTLGAGAFLRCKIAGDLTIPASVEYIHGNYTEGGAFQEVQFSGELTIGEGSKIKSIGSYAFSGCSGLRGELRFSEGLESIGTYAFSNCKALTGELVLPDSLISINAGAFSECSGFTGDLTLGDSLKSIGGSAFARCSGFTGDLTLGKNLESIGASAFANCTGFDGTLTLGSNIKTIDKQAFYDLNLSRTLTFGDSLASTGASAFAYMSNLNGSLTIPASVQTIGSSAFHGCTGLTGELVFEKASKITAIETYTFYGCSNLTGVTLPEKLETIDAYAFYSCSGLTGTLLLPDGVTSVKNNAFQSCSGLTALSLPDGLTEIGIRGLASCSKLTGTLDLPENLTTLGSYAFNPAKEITSLTYSGSGLTDLDIDDRFGLISLETLDLKDSKLETVSWTGTVPTLEEIKLPDTLKTLKLSNKRGLENIDLTECKALTNVDLRSNAIDFSGGKPAEWLEAYEKTTGTKQISGQSINLYIQKGEVKRSVEIGGAFADDYSIKTYHETDLSNNDAWTSFRTATNDKWVSNNRMSATFPVTRTPKEVKTETAGHQTITYTAAPGNFPDLQKLNYNVKLTVGSPEAPAGQPSIVIKTATGGTINTNGLSKTYGDVNFILRADLTNITGIVGWKTYIEEQCENESTSVIAVDEAGKISIEGAGVAYLVANIDETKSNPVKITVNKKPLTITTIADRSKTYGSADATNFSQPMPSGGYGETYADMKLYYTREVGEDVGSYAVYLYDLAALKTHNNNIELNPDDSGFAEGYKAACKKKFESENPNYTLNYTYDANKSIYTINSKLIGLGTLTLKTKVYDGTKTATPSTTQPISGLVTDELNKGVVVNAEAVFDSSDVNWNGETLAAQTGKAVVTMTGAKVKNYSVPASTDTVKWTKTGEGEDCVITADKNGLSANITQKAISCYLQPQGKIYDGNTQTAFESKQAFERAFTGLVEADQKNIDSITADFEDKNVGVDKKVMLSSDKITLVNYKLPAFTAEITPIPLSVTGLTAEDKVYDGTTDATISGTPKINESGIIAGDKVTISTTSDTLKGSFTDKNVGNRKSVAVAAGFGLTGEDAGNYYLKPAAPVQAGITSAPLRIFPTDGQYKALGAINPVLTYTLSGLMDSDRKIVDGELTNEPSANLIRGALSRQPGENVGFYDYTLGSLTANANYILSLGEDVPKFEIRNTNASLKQLSLSEGNLTPAFNPEVETYTVNLKYGSTAVPEVTAVPTDKDAKAEVTKGTNLTETTTIEVTAADNTTKKTYSLNFLVATKVSVTATTVNTQGSDGMIIAKGEGGLGTYEYKLNDGDWQSEADFKNLSPGEYTLHLRDAADTDNTNNISVTVTNQGGQGVETPTSLKANPSSPILTYSVQSITAELTADGVDGAEYVYFLENPGNTNAILNGNILTVTNPGKVTVSARAVKNGSISPYSNILTITVTKTKAVSAAVQETPVTVYGGTNGKIEVTASGGLGTYEYKLGNGNWQNSPSFTNLRAGEYTIYMRDAADIANVTEGITVTVTEIPPTDAVCVNRAIDSLTLPEETVESLTLPTKDIYGERETTIVWSTDNTKALAANGTVIRPDFKAGDAIVTLTATFTCGNVVKTKSFTVTVLKKSAEESGYEFPPAEDTNPEAELTVNGKPVDPSKWSVLLTKGIKEEDKAKLEKNLPEAYTFTSVLFELDFLVDGSVVPNAALNRPVKVTIACETKANMLYKISHLKADGTVEYLDTEKGDGTLTFCVSSFSPFAIVYKEINAPVDVPTYKDVPKNHWAAPYINDLSKRSLLCGYGDGTFRPERKITRSEFCKIIAMASGDDIDVDTATAAFPDTKGHWANGYILWAKNHKIVKGYGNDKFLPDNNISREEVAVILNCYIENIWNTSSVSVLKAFTDVDKVSVWAKDAVSNLQKLCVISGYEDNSYRPQSPATRAEAATMISVFLALEK